MLEISLYPNILNADLLEPVIFDLRFLSLLFLLLFNLEMLYWSIFMQRLFDFSAFLLLHVFYSNVLWWHHFFILLYYLFCLVFSIRCHVDWRYCLLFTTAKELLLAIC